MHACVSSLWLRFFHCILLLGFVACTEVARGAQQDPVDWVDPFIGTSGNAHAFPGATLPFGMLAPSPDCAEEGWDFAGGYRHEVVRVLGFSNTHISGAGVAEFGDLLLQPASGTPWNTRTRDYSAVRDRTSEMATPGWYSVRLPVNGVQVDLTASRRVALQRYRFEAPGRAQVLVDCQHGLHLDGVARVLSSDVRIRPDHLGIEGTLQCRNFVERQVSFVLRFSRPFAHVETLPAGPIDKAPRYLLTFDLDEDRVLEARVAFSTVDVKGAEGNLGEVASKDFGTVRAEARDAWNRLLGRIELEAAPRQRRLFYTALYHALLHPSLISDVDGRVRGPSGRVLAAPPGGYYSTLSLWDTFRGAFPLMALVASEMVDPLLNTLLLHAEDSGILPVWTAWGQESWCMIGNPSLPVIATALADGFTGVDPRRALTAMVATSTRPRASAAASVSIDWNMYEKFGYLPFDLVSNESVSATLETCVGDDAVARVARLCGEPGLAERFGTRARWYRKLLDPETRLVRGRDSRGNWRTPFDPVTPTSPLNNPGDYTEANAWQYTLSIGLMDPEGLREALGGARALGEWLDRFFAEGGLRENRWLGQEALIGQYAHGNEPCHHAAYLYAWSDRPGHGRDRIREIAARFYDDTPSGIIGNDDAGQMSAWYVLSTLGFYPVVPSSGSFACGTPLCDRVLLHLPEERTLLITREQCAGKAGALGGVTLNGEAVDGQTLPYSSLRQGGHLSFVEPE